MTKMGQTTQNQSLGPSALTVCFLGVIRLPRDPDRVVSEGVGAKFLYREGKFKVGKLGILSGQKGK